MPDPIPHGPVPSPRQLAWHRRETYGFVHFTMNTFTDREWGFGDEDPARFAPSALDCRQWVDAARAGGLKALILTAKHHDGFCLWPTATTTHNISRSPFRDGKGDLVRELAEACREAGLAFGLYCSPWDRNNPAYGTPAYVDLYHAQVRELLTSYGPLCEFWFDGANGGDGFYGGAREKRTIDARTYYRFPELWAMCHRLQPGAVLFSDAGPDVRWCGNEQGLAGRTNWCRISPEGFAPGLVDQPDLLPAGDPQGTVWRPSEVDISIRPGWFWHHNERPHCADALFDIWLASVGRNAGMLLNLTPDRRGLIPSEDHASLLGMRQRIDAFQAIDLARGRPITAEGAADGGIGHLVDGDEATWWAAPSTTASITIDLGETGVLGGIRLEEAITFGQRVEAFVVEAKMYQSWHELERGTTIGAQRILALPAIRPSAVRVRVLAAQAPPVLRRIAIYAR
jgi:alpha-L-fucosidase